MPASTPVVEPPSVRVPFCTLLADPKPFDGKVVSTEATATTSFEMGALYDLSCYQKGELVWLVAENDEAQKLIGDLLPPLENKRMTMDLVGRFDLSKGKGFGHRNAYKYQFSVFKVRSFHPIPDSVPWPWQFDQK
jgi:hypothetical protein